MCVQDTQDDVQDYEGTTSMDANIEAEQAAGNLAHTPVSSEHAAAVQNAQASLQQLIRAPSLQGTGLPRADAGPSGSPLVMRLVTFLYKTDAKSRKLMSTGCMLFLY